MTLGGEKVCIESCSDCEHFENVLPLRDGNLQALRRLLLGGAGWLLVGHVLRLAPMQDPFESAWLKWAWAVVDANVLADNVNALAAEGGREMPITFAEEYDPKRHCIILRVHEFDSPFPKHWGLLLGSIVYGFRCALDHVAWAIYKRGKTPDLPPAKERKVYFPICTTRTIFNDSLKTKLPGASRADIARVRLCQPYIKGKRNLDRHTLWVLDELSRLDKHRTVQPVVPVPTTLAYRVIEVVDCVVRRTSAHAPRGVLEPGAELTRFYVKKTGPDPYIDVETRFALDPAVNEQLPLQEFLKKSILIVSLILRQFSEPSPSIKPIVADLPADTLPPGTYPK